jgi:hypothetical protein
VSIVLLPVGCESVRVDAALSERFVLASFFELAFLDCSGFGGADSSLSNVVPKQRAES